MRTRPIMTGAYLRPTLYNGPLPRLVPQPAHITGMITWRRKARERRQAKFDGLVESTRLLGSEAQFERELSQLVSQDGAAFDRVFADYAHAWRECLVHVLANDSFADRLECAGAPIKDLMNNMSASFDREKARQEQPYPPEMLAAIKEARREKIRNKTREGERERRGEVTNRLRRRMRQGPPAHVLALMTDKQRRMDHIARGAGEAGYVAQVKRKLGHKLRDPNVWKTELGQPENMEALRRMEMEIEVEHSRRRASVDEDSVGQSLML